MLNDCLSTRRQITVNDLPVGRSVDETMRLIKAFQFTVRPTSSHAPSIPLHIIFFLRTNTAKFAQPTGTKDLNRWKPILRVPWSTLRLSAIPLMVPMDILTGLARSAPGSIRHRSTVEFVSLVLIILLFFSIDALLTPSILTLRVWRFLTSGSRLLFIAQDWIMLSVT